VTERPIIMRAESVRAILAGTKTQTRRIVKPQAAEIVEFMPGTWALPTELPGSFEEIRQHYTPGDRLWVREAWAARLDQDHLAPRDLPRGTVGYWADGPGQCCRTGCAGAAGKVRSPIHMPRWASRLTLEVTDVRVERLQEISEEDAKAEGVEITVRENGALAPFRDLWRSIHGPDSWDANPWVWVIGFRRVDGEAVSEARP
jgi:hypothetical protein